MKIITISDTHNQHDKLINLPEADCVIHAGDVSSRGTEQEVLYFLNWFSKLPYQYKIFIAGNHDFIFERNPNFIKNNLPENVIYLENNNCIIEGIEIYGTPITPWFHNWAFNQHRGSAIKKYWDLIPDTTNILISHGPLYQTLDLVKNNYNPHPNVGCQDLKDKVLTMSNLKMFICGHIHEAAGVETFKISNNRDLVCVNASVLNERYVLYTSPYKLFEYDVLNHSIIRLL